MRLDFMVLLLAAFSHGEESKVYETYVNFTAMLLERELKSASDTREGSMRMQRYLKAIKRAQPWLRFAIGMTVGEGFVTLLRESCSGVESIELSLTDGGGCIEFICIVLGIVLSEKEEFSHDPDVEIDEKDIRVDVPELPPADTPHSGSYFTNSDFTSQSAVQPGFNRSASRMGTSYSVSSDLPSADQSSATSSATFKSRITSAGSKRGPDDEMGGWKDSGSAWGRGTTGYTVVAADDGKARPALKTSWQDVARANDQIVVLKRLHGHELHPNIVIPSVLCQPKAKDEPSASTFGLIWAFLTEEIQEPKAENCFLTVTTSALWRPVAYFWSPSDFVREVIGALLGHRYLREIGILHRDISENHIVLSLCRGVLGPLLDFDMATVDSPNMRLDSPPPPRLSREEILASLVQSDSPLLADDKAERVGTTPYMSVGVLDGYPHTHYDDIESIFYVLGPLEKEALGNAEVQGYPGCWRGSAATCYSVARHVQAMGDR
ncbi:hypothetical protein EDD16DRAFT_1671415 [Pisolithus croceorrhizus]|nr:hypothetical protein EDD16DRAFT_1671415 [Pisolithus croceorrhizus]